jgi:hypothetical protein
MAYNKANYTVRKKTVGIQVAKCSNPISRTLLIMIWRVAWAIAPRIADIDELSMLPGSSTLEAYSGNGEGGILPPDGFRFNVTLWVKLYNLWHMQIVGALIYPQNGYIRLITWHVQHPIWPPIHSNRYTHFFCVLNSTKWLLFSSNNRHLPVRFRDCHRDFFY